MQCFHPLTLPDRTVPCGKCVPCLSRRQSDWTIRLQKEYAVSSSAYFVTLTYSDEFVPKFGELNVLNKRDVQLFLKRLRKAIEPSRIRYFCCGEYGPTTFRPHYHLIIFNILPKDVEHIHLCWRKGYTVCACVTPARIPYVAKYSTAQTLLPKALTTKDFRQFVLCSRHPAIGASYLSESVVNFHRETLSTTLVINGYKKALPKFYKDRIFDDQMKADISERATQHINRSNQEHLDKYYESYDKLHPLGPHMIDLQREQLESRTKKLFKTRKL